MAAALLKGSSSVLDIGFSMSPPEWMGVLLRLSELGSRLVGIDRATEPSNTDAVFARAKSVSELNEFRDPATDSLFLCAADRFLSPHGRLIISVPAGSGGAILHQDSLGYYTHQFEYGPEQWAALLADSRYTVEAEEFYRYDSLSGWERVNEFVDLTDQTSTLMPYATGCAMVVLRKII